MLDVVAVWAPRLKHPKWRDYAPLMALQHQTVVRAGHRHVVVAERATDVPADYTVVMAELPDSLMHAILAGQLAYVRQWSGDYPFVLADLDCMVCRDLAPVFDGSFDIGLTRRDNPVAPIQNGAMYFAAGCKPAAIAFLERALELCGAHWGGDQEALAQAVAPVPAEPCLQTRFGARFAFFSTRLLNYSPKAGRFKRNDKRFIAHFKGETKDMAAHYAKVFLGVVVKGIK